MNNNSSIWNQILVIHLIDFIWSLQIKLTISIIIISDIFKSDSTFNSINSTLETNKLNLFKRIFNFKSDQVEWMNLSISEL